MNQFSVATANFGGIFTEDIGMMNPWIGTVSPEAARLQVEAGARAIVFDIWPDPGNPKTPVVAAMLDTNEWGAQRWWRDTGGLKKGVGRYSNWQHLTRNRLPVGDVLKETMRAAFPSAQSAVEKQDPFFLILKLHGAMNRDYLNTLGVIVREATKGHQMGPEWGKASNQRGLCTAPVSAFWSKVFIMVIPDVQPGYNILPNTNTYAGFTSTFLETTLGEITNVLEQGPNQIWFEPGSLATITATTQPNCQDATKPQQSLPQTGFVVIQPSIGGQSTDNSVLFMENSFTNCLQSGAQFVAVNLFSPNRGDGVVGQFFDDATFGKYSFKKGA
jgi:hypothetical protein